MENTISTGPAAKRLGVTVKTLQRWEREGCLLPIVRTVTNRRCYTERQIREFLGLHQPVGEPVCQIAYCRVSSAEQRSDLAIQRRVSRN